MSGLHHKPAHPPPRPGGGALPGRAAAAPSGPVGLVRHARPGHELLLMPGQLYFGREPASIRTLLGSCVALTLWHPQRHLGGMCHYLLPERHRSHGLPADGRYGSEAIALLLDLLARAGTRATEYEVHLYGGADTLPDHVQHKTQVGVRNIELGWTLIDQHGFQLVGVDVGDNVPRTVRLDMHSGEVTMRRSER
ncbi:MAG: chemotaxis protein CheD [Burkholderiaceae bacterium]|nr:chemotaxis protein CheD [Burkholderiaceae bacterium]